MLRDNDINVKSLLMSPIHLALYGKGKYSSPPKVLENKFNLRGISKEYNFPNGMSAQEFEKEIMGRQGAGTFVFILGSKKSGLSKLSKKDFYFILENNKEIKDIFIDFNFESFEYNKQTKLAYNILMGMSSCFNEDDIRIFLKTRFASKQLRNHPDLNTEEYVSTYEEVYKNLNQEEEFDRSEHTLGWIPSIETLKLIKNQI